MSQPFEVVGDHPEFTDEQLRTIRQERQRKLWNRWNKLHAEKNRTANRYLRDAITVRMRDLEREMERL